MIMSAQNLARDFGQQQIDALHLLLAIITDTDNIALNLLNRLGVNIEDLEKRHEQLFVKFQPFKTRKPLDNFI